MERGFTRALTLRITGSKRQEARFRRILSVL
jgi:hypothetical protein